MDWLAAGADILTGGLISEIQDKNNEERSRDAFERQVYLRNTAHQASVDDLRAAGLNPILSVTRGATATPSVAAPSGAPGDWQSISKGQASSAAAQASRQSAEVGKSQDLLMRQQIELAGEQATAARYDGLLKQAQAAQAYSQIPNINADTALKLANVPLVKQQTETSAASARQADAQTSNLSQELQMLQERVKALRTEGKIDESMFGEVMRIINRGVQSIRGSVPVPGR